MASFVQDGDILNHTPGSAVAAGDVVVIGSIVGVATQAIAASAQGAVTVEGVFAMPKPAAGSGSETISAGAKVYYYATSGIANTTTGVVAGYAAAEAVTGSSTVDVLLSRA